MRFIEREVPLKSVLDGPFCVRRDEKLKDLAKSIEAIGLQELPIFTPAKKKGKFTIVKGHRRTHAIRKILKKKRIRARIAIGTPIEIYRLEIADFLKENFEPMEQALALQAWMNELHLPIKELANATRLSEDVIRDRLRLLELHPSVQEMIWKRELTASNAERLATLPKEEQPTVGKSMKWFSQAQAERYVSEYKQLRESHAEAFHKAEETNRVIQPLKVDLVTSLTSQALQRVRDDSPIQGKPEVDSEDQPVKVGGLEVLKLNFPFLRYVSSVWCKCPFISGKQQDENGHIVDMKELKFSTTPDQLPALLHEMQVYIQTQKPQVRIA